MFSCLLLVSGCTSEKQEEKKPESKIVEIGVEDAIQKIKKKQDFVLLVTRKQCKYCEAMLEMLDTTIKEHQLVIYNAVMRDDTVDHLNEDVEKLKVYLERPDQTPHYYYIKNGEVEDTDKGYTEFQPERFWDWITKNNLEGMQ